MFSKPREITRHGVTWQVVEPHVGGFEFWNDWERANWEQDTLDIVDRFVTPNSTFVDVGAWIGPVTLWADRIAARVIAIEPDPLALKHLQQNVAANATGTTIVAGAISHRTGTCHIAAHEDGWGSSMTHLANEGTEVPCWTLPDLFDTYSLENVSLVKMDIEGGESIVLEHAAPFLAEKKIPLLVAMHEPWWSRPVERSWFDGFRNVEGECSGWHSVLAEPWT